MADSSTELKRVPIHFNRMWKVVMEMNEKYKQEDRYHIVNLMGNHRVHIGDTISFVSLSEREAKEYKEMLVENNPKDFFKKITIKNNGDNIN